MGLGGRWWTQRLDLLWRQRPTRLFCQSRFLFRKRHRRRRRRRLGYNFSLHYRSRRSGHTSGPGLGVPSTLACVGTTCGLGATGAEATRCGSTLITARSTGSALLTTAWGTTVTAFGAVRFTYVTLLTWL